jgi:hypothetical protein
MVKYSWRDNMAKTVTQNCLVCDKPFEALLAEVKRGNGKFCNLTCNAIHRNKNRKPKRKEEPIVWSNNIAYLVGLITSDGNLEKEKKRLKVTNKDFEIIEHTRDIVKNEITGRTYKPVESEKDGCNWWNYQFTSHSFYDFCTNIGLMPNKSLIITELDIPDEYFSHFLRGLIDGDGNYSFNRDKYINIRIFSGAETFLKNLLIKLKEMYKIDGGSVFLGSKSYVLHICEADSLILLPKIYKDDTYSLSRKKQIILPYI